MLKTMKLGSTDLNVPVIAVGCMRLCELEKPQAQRFLKSALDLGANFFDHADIYGDGASETIFARALSMNDDVREKVILQSKCGIRTEAGTYDFSKQHILDSVDGILKRLKTDYLDVLLLHRPDALMEPKEVAEAFERLEATGKVRHFGVSNHNPGQIRLLQKHVKQPIAVNQLQFGLGHCGILSEGICVNLPGETAGNEGGILDYCRYMDITIQAWSPLQYGFFEGVILGSDRYPVLNQALERMGDKYGISSDGVAAAWILRHPAGIQPISGTTKPDRLKSFCQGAEVTLTREEWYGLYRAAGNQLP